MKERPIIFNADMVRAVLDGRKTQTRRIMKNQPVPSKTREGDYWFRCDKARSMIHVSDLKPGASPNLPDAHEYFSMCCPFGAVGDRLWVREAWQCTSFETNEYGHVEGVDYMREIPKQKPQSPAWGLSYEANGFDTGDAEERGFPWRPSIHMPRWASRITLEITGVRVERLWDISEDDAKAEGCTFEALRFKPGTREVEEMGHTAVYQFGGLWQSLYGDDSWQANPWVWVIEFKRVEVE